MESRLESLQQSLTGNVDKAYLLLRKEIIDEEDTEKGVTGALSKISALGTELQNGLNIISEGASLLGINTGLSNVAGRQGYIPIKVQYNPSKVQFRGVRNGREIGHDGTYTDYDRPAETTLSMELIFDSMNPATSFMLDKTLVDNVKGLFKDSTSVRSIVELLVAATVFNSTRWVCFAWGDMSFWGELVSVDAAYTMFNTQGEPVRAKVNLTIRQDMTNVTDLKGTDNEKEMSENRTKMQKQWSKQFKALGKKKPLASSSVSNLLNLDKWK